MTLNRVNQFYPDLVESKLSNFDGLYSHLWDWEQVVQRKRITDHIRNSRIVEVLTNLQDFGFLGVVYTTFTDLLGRDRPKQRGVNGGDLEQLCDQNKLSLTLFSWECFLNCVRSPIIANDDETVCQNGCKSSSTLGKLLSSFVNLDEHLNFSTDW